MVKLVKWTEWNPGLNNDSKTLGEVFNTLPGNQDVDIHWLVRLIENPKSPVSLPGSISLFNHDCVHILLGRGLLAQDEAFVIGFTMGTARTLKSWHRNLFRFITRSLYPKIYKFSDNDLISYDLGYHAAHTMTAQRLHRFDFTVHMETKLKDLRKVLCIDTKMLKNIYQTEARQIPDSQPSKRLPL